MDFKFYKKRVLFGVPTTENCKKSRETVVYESQPPDDVWTAMEGYQSRRRIDMRLSEPDCAVIVAEEDGQPAGWAWVLIGGNRWHDKMYVRDGDSLLFDAYVRPEFRRQGIYADVNLGVREFARKNDAGRLTAVVEVSNIPSLRAHESCGMEIIATNCLFKFFGRNIVTLLRGDGGLSVAVVPLLDQAP